MKNESIINYFKSQYIANSIKFSQFLLTRNEKFPNIWKEDIDLIRNIEDWKIDQKYLDEVFSRISKYINEYDVRIVDVTLREWDQAPGGWMNKFEKAIIALLLKEAWIDVIEVWFAANPADYYNIDYILNHIWDRSDRNAPYLSTLCRATISDVEKAKELLKRYKKPRIHIFYATSEKHMDSKVAKKAEKAWITKEQYVINSFLQSLDSAIELKSIQNLLEIEVSFEDAWNTDNNKLLELSKIMIDKWIENNVKIIINLPSTLWDKTWNEVYDMFSSVHKWLYEKYWDWKWIWELSTHNHNDNAEALTCAIEAVKWWATNVETSILWLWEWAWNTQTHIFLNKINETWHILWVNHLENYTNNKIKIQELWVVSRIIKSMLKIDQNTIVPYVWEFVHKNTSWVHAANWDVYRTMDSIEKYWWEKPTEFFSSRWWTNQVTSILSYYWVDFSKESINFRNSYVLKIQRLAEVVKTLYPATMYAIYKEMKKEFSIKSIKRVKNDLIIKLKVNWKDIDINWIIDKENWQIAWLIYWINDFIWKNHQFDLLDVPRNMVVTPLRKIISDYKWEKIFEDKELYNEIIKIVWESEIYYLLADFYIKIESIYTLLTSLKHSLITIIDDKNNELIKNEIKFIYNSIWVSNMWLVEVEENLNNLNLIKNELNKIVFSIDNLNNILENYDNIFDKFETIITKYDLLEEYYSWKNNILGYIESKANFDNTFWQKWVVYVEVAMNSRKINSVAISNDLWEATAKAIIYSALPEIEKCVN